jgi:pimeloyl-ACP methyl ester carboxylesterase
MDLSRVEANGVDFAVLTEGPEDGPLALCLHGFPDSARTWRHLAPGLARAGFRVAAPYMRGYAPSAVPADGRYQTGALVADACALHQALGADQRAVVIGHDWGAVAALGAGAMHPDYWSRVVAASVPPGPALAQGFLDYDQLRRSWYMFFFQSPLADLAVPLGDLSFIERLWRDWSPGFDHPRDVAAAQDCLRDPLHLSAAIGYYRAQFGSLSADPALEAEQAAAGSVPPQPTLYLHGTEDGCIGVGLAQGVAALLSEGSDVAIIPGAGHFLHLDRPGEFNQRVLAFLQG